MVRPHAATFALLVSSIRVVAGVSPGGRGRGRGRLFHDHHPAAAAPPGTRTGPGRPPPNLMADSYTGGLRGTAYLINGGASDDGGRVLPRLA